MPTILTKKSDTPGAVPATGNLTNAAGGAELAVNTADKRLFTINSSSAVVELGTNPSSLTCADASFTVARISSGTVTQLTSTSATITTLTSTSASVTNLTATSIVISNLSIASANITTLTSGSATITNLINSGGTANGVLYLNGSKVATSGSALTFNGSLLTATSGSFNGNATPASGESVEVTYASNAGFVTTFNRTSSAYTDLNLRSLNMRFSTGGGETMRLDSSGNLGLGVTPSAWGSNYKALESTAGNSFYATSNASALASNAYNDNSNWRYKTTAAASLFATAQGQHLWFTAPSGTAGNAITFTQAMTLDASGNLGIGTTSPSARLDARTGTSPNLAAILVGLSGSNNYYTANTHVWQNGSSTDTMTLTSGNLGLGVTPSAWSTAGKNMQFGNGPASIGTQNNGDANFMHNAYESPAGTFKYASSGIGSLRYQLDINNNAHKWYYAASGTANNNITFTQAMTLDSSGNLGLGGTPLTNSTFTTQTINGTNAILELARGGSRAARFYADGTGTTIGAYTSTPLIFITNDTERARINAGGGLSIGTTSDSGAGNILIGSSAKIYGFSSTNSAQQSYIELYDGNGDMTLNTGFSTSVIKFRTNGGERARITAGGYFKASNDGTYIGSTGVYHELNSTNGDYIVQTRNSGSVGIAGVRINYSASTPNGTGNEFLYCDDSTALRASIRSNGGLANYQANDVNLSDQRVKKDIKPLGSMWDKFKALEIVTFKYKDQTHDDDNIGVIAQQVESVAPEFIDTDGFGKTPEGEEPLKTVYTTDMYHAAIKALQEAMARIEQLEAKVAALEA